MERTTHILPVETPGHAGAGADCLPEVAGVIYAAAAGKPEASRLTMTVKAEGETAQVKIIGYISEWRDTSADFESQVQQAIDQGIKNVVVYVNSLGGSVFEANEISNIIKKFPGKITGEVGAVAASAATTILCACSHIKAAQNSSLMIHRPSMWVDGNEDDIKAALKLLESIQETMLNEYEKRTKLSKAEISALWQNDYWMNASEALEKGFVDEVTDLQADSESFLEDAVKMGISLPASLVAAMAKPGTQNPAPKPQPESKTTTDNQMDIKVYAALLGLLMTASEDEVKAAILALKAKAEEADKLKAKLEKLEADAQSKAIDTLIQAAIDDKRIGEGQKDHFTAFAKADFDACKAALEAMPKAEAPSVASMMQQAATGPQADRKDWDYEKWAEKDMKGLMEMRKTDPDRFKALYKGLYGVEPSKAAMEA